MLEMYSLHQPASKFLLGSAPMQLDPLLRERVFLHILFCGPTSQHRILFLKLIFKTKCVKVSCEWSEIESSLQKQLELFPGSPVIQKLRQFLVCVTNNYINLNDIYFN